MSEKFFSGTKNSKQTNKQTNKNVIFNDGKNLSQKPHFLLDRAKVIVKKINLNIIFMPLFREFIKNDVHLLYKSKSFFKVNGSVVMNASS